MPVDLFMSLLGLKCARFPSIQWLHVAGLHYIESDGDKVERSKRPSGNYNEFSSGKAWSAEDVSWVYSAQTLKSGVTGRAELDSVAERTARTLCNLLLQPGAAKVLIDQAPFGDRVSAASRGHLQTHLRRLLGKPAV
jgi:hypothetical protein